VARRRIVLFTAGHTERNGGLARHSRLLVEGFAADGWEVRAISRSGSLRRPVITRGTNHTVLELPGFGSPRLGGVLYLVVAVPLGIVWARRAAGCLGVHLGTTTVAAGISARTWRRPYLGLSTTSGSWGEVTEALRCRPWGLRRRVLRAATYLVAQSSATAPELAPLTAADHIAVVPNPTLLPDPPPLDDRPRVLVIGRLAEEKGTSEIVAAWRAIVDRVPDARLDFVGTGGEWRSVEEELRADVATDDRIAGTITFSGWIDDIPAVLGQHDVFVIASATEGMSNALVEACAYGRVVVASDIEPNRAVLGDDHPLLFRAGDAEDLARVLELALTDAEVRASAVSNAIGAVQGNDVGTVVRRHAELLGAG
jgi:glycosyltransferase involved in cell wall biosynthesis